MGLLSKAAWKEKESDFSALDAMGKALRERLGRLNKKPTTPYTALSLLKVYGTFHAGACFNLQGDVYTSYASVGLGIRKISIPLEKIQWSENAQKKFIKLDSGFSMGIDPGEGEKELVYWLFPLNNTEPRENIMLLCAKESAFNPEIVSTILEDSCDKLLPFSIEETEEIKPSLPDSVIEELPLEEDNSKETPDNEFPVSKPDSQSNESTETIGEKIKSYHIINGRLNCILLENPYLSSEEKLAFCDSVEKMIDSLGMVIRLLSGSPLILMPGTSDLELFVHRLSATSRIKILDSFKADGHEKILDRLQFSM